MLIIENLLGLLTFVFFSVALLPQIVHMMRLKDSRGVSAFWPALAATACLCGLSYVTLSTNGHPPFWLALDYTVGFILNSAVLFLKAKYSDHVFKKAIQKSIPDISDEGADSLLKALREPHNVSKRYSTVDEMFSDFDKANYYYEFIYNEDTDTFQIKIDNVKLGTEKISPPIPRSLSVNRDVENALQFTLDTVNDQMPRCDDCEDLGEWEEGK